LRPTQKGTVEIEKTVRMSRNLKIVKEHAFSNRVMRRRRFHGIRGNYEKEG
jgi:hypothetical protein